MAKDFCSVKLMRFIKAASMLFVRPSGKVLRPALEIAPKPATTYRAFALLATSATMHGSPAGTGCPAALKPVTPEPTLSWPAVLMMGRSPVGSLLRLASTPFSTEAYSGDWNVYVPERFQLPTMFLRIQLAF